MYLFFKYMFIREKTIWSLLGFNCNFGDNHYKSMNVVANERQLIYADFNMLLYVNCMLMHIFQI